MPAKVLPRRSNVNGNSTNGGPHISQPRASENLGRDDSSSGADGRTRKRFQKSTSDGSISLRRPEVPSTDIATESQSTFTTRRRQSIRDQKAPPGARPFAASSANESITSDPLATNAFSQPSTLSIRQVPRSRRPSVNNNNTSDFNFGTKSLDYGKNSSSSTEGYQFLPAVNFDEFQTSLNTLGDSGSNDAFTSWSSTEKFARAPTGNITGNNTIYDSASAKKPPPSNIQLPLSRSGSLLSRQSSSARQRRQTSSQAEQMGPPTAPALVKGRRQSHFPTSTPSATVTRPPRKSIGPGVLTTNPSEAPFLGSSYFSQRSERDTIGNTQITHLTEESLSAGGGSRQGREFTVTPSARSSKTKSLHVPSRTVQNDVGGSSSTPENSWPILLSSNARSPMRSGEKGTITPLSGKRLSLMPGHASGLGARTISPTDARRAKRLSMMPNPPPLPYTPPISLADQPVSETRLTTDSPSLIPRKSTTPSSNRTTPDHHRKSYNSVISNSSSTSYNSIRPLGVTSRVQQSSSLSRLPTFKNRIESNSAGAEEEVPPVPAIPKAYESPKNEIEVPFFAARKSSLPFDASSLNSNCTVDRFSVYSSEKETAKSQHAPNLRRSLTSNDDVQDEKASYSINMNGKTLPPLRLPPINLLPLSAPTADKIAALQDRLIDETLGTVTPPLRGGPPKTPSTPMTASKTSFFSRHLYAGDPEPTASQIRSSSSHYALRSEVSSIYAASGPSPSTPGPTDIRVGRKAVSPFLSSSLPKVSGDFGSLRPKTSGDRNVSNSGADFKSSRLTGPRAQTSTRVAKAEAPSVGDPDVPSFGTSIRRKLSLTRKRSASKAEVASGRDSEIPPQPPKHDAMPPPKLPASATWNGSWLTNPDPASKSNYLHTRRKTSASEMPIKHDRARSEIFSTEMALEKDMSADYHDALVATRPADSKLLSIANPNGSDRINGPPQPRGVEPQLDRDDHVAEEEMKKLALKRKDTESAAKELDELRRRAVPKERVTPAQAIRAAKLNIFERGEIIDYKEIYFCGTNNAKKLVGDLEIDAANFGYDDDRGDYNIVLGDHLAYRYEVIDVLGKGSFGQVVRCIDHKTGGLVAIKIIRNKKRFHQQALVEVNILQKLKEWDPQAKYSMVHFVQSFYFRDHLCISTELLGMNLYEFIKIHEFRGFSLKLIRRFTKQLLNSLILLKSHRVIHCDLKPENILLAHPAHSEIKVIDFGSSCLENEKVYTYIQSRFYRSPEVILGMTYGMPIDMWSLGCILAELLTGYPIFPGENEQEQLACIMEVFGPPDKHLIEKSTRKKLFFDSLGKPRIAVSSKGKRRRPSSKTLQQTLKCDDEAFLDFITRCLRWDPEKRMKPDEAIQHEYVTGMKPVVNRSLRSAPPSTLNINSSPIKRFNSMHAPSSQVRPLPDTPAGGLKNASSLRPREMQNSSSPNKAGPKRHSTMIGIQNGLNSKRAMNGPGSTPTSALPRLGGPRLVSSARSDLASAAAVAATTKTR